MHLVSHFCWKRIFLLLKYSIFEKNKMKINDLSSRQLCVHSLEANNSVDNHTVLPSTNLDHHLFN